MFFFKKGISQIGTAFSNQLSDTAYLIKQENKNYNNLIDNISAFVVNNSASADEDRSLVPKYSTLAAGNSTLEKKNSDLVDNKSAIVRNESGIAANNSGIVPKNSAFVGKNSGSVANNSAIVPKNSAISNRNSGIWSKKEYLIIYFYEALMRVLYSLLLFCFSFIPNFLAAQTFSEGKLHNEIEFKIGEELYRKALVGGIGYNIYMSKHITFTPQLEAVGLPILTGTVRFEIHVSKEIKIIPEAGLGIVFLGLFSSTTSTWGGLVSYKINEDLNLFFESKIYNIYGDIVAIGSSSFRKMGVKEYPPIVLMFGIRF